MSTPPHVFKFGAMPSTEIIAIRHNNLASFVSLIQVYTLNLLPFYVATRASTQVYATQSFEGMFFISIALIAGSLILVFMVNVFHITNVVLTNKHFAITLDPTTHAHPGLTGLFTDLSQAFLSFTITFVFSLIFTFFSTAEAVMESKGLHRIISIVILILLPLCALLYIRLLLTNLDLKQK